ncbi:MAG: 1,4-alpha-glucan branching protein GlgB [Myxococcales bacterium]|nr:1,4-alpha-glucan branching protein GlgB [Myxococcales bacterium]
MTVTTDSAFSLLSSDDAHFFGEGTHQRLYRQLGAHPVRAGAAGATGTAARDGTYFAVWAPNATAVAVVGDWNGWQRDRHWLRPHGSTGIWETFVVGVAAGALYKYAITDRSGATIEKSDPVAFAAEPAPGTASRVCDSEHVWHDAEWMKTRRHGARAAAPISIYEVHLGSWRKPYGHFMGYRELGAALADHVSRLGFTHVELMPVMEHPFYGSWGYQVTGYFAPTLRYGTADDLMAMIDLLHRRGIGVILDWVPAHFPTDAHSLGLFDGTHLYEHEDPRRGFHPDWTSYIFNYGRNEVRAFLISSAMYWLDVFHADGIRVDGVASMLYRDYSRKEGEWIPDHDGSNRDRDAERFLQQLNVAVRETYPDVLMIAEESTSWPGVTRAPEVGGLGFSYKWDMGWMHDTLTYVHQDPLHRKHHHGKLTFRAMYAQSERFTLPLSHDEVVHGKGSLLTKCAGDRWQQLATLRALYAYQWTTPGKKLLFMGGELAVPSEWNHDGELDFGLADRPEHAGILRWISDLNTAYRGQPALHRRDHSDNGFQWLVVDDADHSVIAYARLGEDRDPPVVVVINFTPVVRDSYRVGTPRGGRWMELLNSDSASYGGGNVGNFGSLDAEPVGVGQQDFSLRLTLPPLAALVLVATDGAS